MGGRGACGARTVEEQVVTVEQRVVRLNLKWGKEAQTNVACTIDK